MKGNGNGIRTLLQKLYFMFLPTCGMRSKYIMKHSAEFKRIGGGIFWQSRKYPADPELLSIGKNVFVTAGVCFINHDVIGAMLNKKFPNYKFENLQGCIEVGDNVMIGANTIVMPNVRIGSNVVIGAGSIVTKDIPNDSVAAGIPCRVLGKFEVLVDKYKCIKSMTSNELWVKFNGERNN